MRAGRWVWVLALLLAVLGWGTPMRAGVRAALSGARAGAARVRVDRAGRGWSAVGERVQMVAVPDGDRAEGQGDWRDQMRGWLRQPDVDVLLVLVGLLLIYVELNVPGVVLPGALGVLLVLLGAYGLWAFPLSVPAAMALVLGAMLFPLEAKLGGHGGLAAAGTVLLVYGLAHLVTGGQDAPRVHLGTALAAGVSFGVITAGLGWVASRARRSKRLMGEEALVGARAVVRMELAPEGQVEMRGELWQARMEDGSVAGVGTLVEVRRREALLLLVAEPGGREP